MNAPLCTEDKIEAIFNILTNVGMRMHAINNGNGCNDDMVAIVDAVAKARAGDAPSLPDLDGLVARFSELQSLFTAHIASYSKDYWRAVFVAAIAALREWRPSEAAFRAIEDGSGEDCNVDSDEIERLFHATLDAITTLSKEGVSANNG